VRFQYNISATAEASDFKFGAQLGFAKYHKITRRIKGGHGSGLGELPKFGGYPLIFTQYLKLATSNLVYSLGSSKPIVKSHTEEKNRHGPGLEKRFKIVRFPFNICATTEASNFKFGMLLEFAKAQQKHTQR